MTRVSFSPHLITSLSVLEPHADNDRKLDINKVVVFRLPSAFPAGDQTGGRLLPAHMHRPAGW